MSARIVGSSILVAFVVSVFSQAVKGQIDIRKLFREIFNFPLWAVTVISLALWSYDTFQNTTVYRLWAAARTPRVRVDHSGVYDLPIYNSASTGVVSRSQEPGEERDITNVTPVSPRRAWNH
jgi:hypothetical protein